MLSLQTVTVQGAFNARLPVAPSIGHSFRSFQFPSTDDELSEASLQVNQAQVKCVGGLGEGGNRSTNKILGVLENCGYIHP